MAMSTDEREGLFRAYSWLIAAAGSSMMCMRVSMILGHLRVAHYDAANYMLDYTRPAQSYYTGSLTSSGQMDSFWAVIVGGLDSLYLALTGDGEQADVQYAIAQNAWCYAFYALIPRRKEAA